MSSAPLPAGLDDGSSPAAPADGGDHQLVLARRYDLALLDLDGVVYRGADAVPGAALALAAARREGMRLSFVTNNASRPPEEVAHHLEQFGVPARADEVVTSAQAAATMLVELIGLGGLVLVVGGAGLRAAVAEVGLVSVPTYDAVPRPQAVIQGFSPDLRYEDLAQATLAVAAGAIWVATNTDTTLPTARGLQPGNGTLVAAVAAATGRRPLVAGKPERALVDEAVHRCGARRPLCVGDRLDTDIEGAVRAGLDSLLVLTGVSTLADLLVAGPGSRPTYLAPDLTALATAPVPLPVLASAGVADLSGWSAKAEGARLVLLREGADADLWDAVRLLAITAWSMADAGRPLIQVDAAPEVRDALLGAGLPQSLFTASGRDNGPRDPRG